MPAPRFARLLPVAALAATVLLLPAAAGAAPPGGPVSGALCIGDSVMLGAGPQYQNTLSGLCSVVDATVSRQMSAGDSAAAAHGPPFPSTVVIGLGTNGTITTTEVDQLLAVLASVPRVVLVTNQVNGGRSWEGPNNAILRATPGRYPNQVVLADWKAASDAHPEYFASDGIHLNKAGANAYAATIAAVGAGPALPPAPPGPALASIGGDQLLAARVGPGGDIQVRTRTGASTWAPWGSVGGGTTVDPDLASWGPGRLDVFVLGLDGAVWHRGSQGGSAFGWESLGGSFLGPPAAVSWAPDRIDVFGRGLDGAIWSAYWNGARWSGWYSLGGQLQSAPDAASRGNGRWDVVAQGPDGAMYLRSWTGSAFTAWRGLGGGFTSAPGATSWGGNRIDLFARGLDGAVWSTYLVGDSLAGWYSLGGQVRTAPDAASRAFGTWDVIAGTDTALYMRTWTGTAFTDWTLVPA